MKYSNNVINVLTALEFEGIGKAWVVKNIKPNMSDDELIKKIKVKVKQIDNKTFYNKQEEVKENIDKISEYVDGFIAWGDENFLFKKAGESNKCNRNTKTLKDSEIPVFFAYKGDLKLLNIDNLNLAVIGLLNPKETIKEIEEKVLKILLSNNAVIVSGLAHGCDSIAHKMTLKYNGVTVAILPSTLANIIPSDNRELAEEIVLNGGLLISEYYKEANTKEQISRFVERDRLQALFSDIVILSASYSECDTLKNKKLDSGSKHAMKKAEEYGIKRAIMYDEKIFNDEQFNLNKEFLEKYKKYPSNYEHINEENKDFKVLSIKNTDKIIKAFIKFKKNSLANTQLVSHLGL